MGRMKFMFPNAQGIYLHDTPDRELLSEAARLFSGGCVRLEDAPRLGRWLFGRPLNPKGARPEQKVMLPTPVPVFLTYLTAVPSGSDLTFYDDIYGRDAVRLAQLRGGRAFAVSR
jgi:murein L,D-transpeptidase YcbB/YkuD